MASERIRPMQSLPPSILSTLPPSWCGVHSHMWVWLSCMSSLKANQSPRMSTAVFKTVVWLTVLQRLVLRCCSRTALHATPHTPSRNGLLQVRWSAFLTGQPKSRHIALTNSLIFLSPLLVCSIVSLSLSLSHPLHFAA